MFKVVERAAFGLVLIGGFGLAVFMLVAPGDPSAISTTLKAQAPLQDARATRAPTTKRNRSASARTERTRRSPALTTVVVVAARGSSWLELRAGSATGRSLYQGTLLDGQMLRYKAKRIWLRAGAASHLDITVNGKPLERSLFGTVDTVLPPETA